jgi:hypothetical protein
VSAGLDGRIAQLPPGFCTQCSPPTTLIS